MEHNETGVTHQERAAMDPIPLPESRVTRVEVIDHHTAGGRAFVFGPEPDAKVEVEYQDDGRTMKIFISKK